MKKECPVCCREFTGRSDKRYCSAQCKNPHHNAVWKEELTVKIDHTLHRNKIILQQLMPANATNAVIDRAILENLGFRFEFMTGLSVSPEGKLMKIVYNFCWSELENSRIGIERVPVEMLAAWRNG